MVTITYARYNRDKETGMYGNKVETFTITEKNVNSAWKKFAHEKENNNVFEYMPLYIVNICEN